MALPFCKFFGECPRCFYQDLEYDEQVRIKKDFVKEEIGVVPEVVKSNEDKFYKYRAVFQVKRTTPDNVAVGYAMRSGFIFGVDSCPILRPKINDVIKPISKILSREGISTWDPTVNKGKLMGITVITNDDMLIASFNLRRSVFLKKMTYNILSIEGFTGVWWVVKGEVDSIVGGRGNMFLHYRNNGILLKISPFGVYPDNLGIINHLWEILHNKHDALAVGTGLLTAPESTATYIEENPLVIREIEENLSLRGIYRNINAESLGVFSFLHNESFPWIVVNTDRFSGEIPQKLGRNIVLVGEKFKPLKRALQINGLRVEKVYLFDAEPYTNRFILVVISKR